LDAYAYVCTYVVYPHHEIHVPTPPPLGIQFSRNDSPVSDEKNDELDGKNLKPLIKGLTDFDPFTRLKEGNNCNANRRIDSASKNSTTNIIRYDPKDPRYDPKDPSHSKILSNSNISKLAQSSNGAIIKPSLKQIKPILQNKHNGQNNNSRTITKYQNTSSRNPQKDDSLVNSINNSSNSSSNKRVNIVSPNTKYSKISRSGKDFNDKKRVLASSNLSSDLGDSGLASSLVYLSTTSSNEQFKDALKYGISRKTDTDSAIGKEKTQHIYEANATNEPTANLPLTPSSSLLTDQSKGASSQSPQLLRYKYKSWGSVNYYEFSESFGDSFFPKSEKFTINGFMHASYDSECYDDVMSLNTIYNPSRQIRTEYIRAAIGAGISIEVTENKIFLENLGRIPIFVQSIEANSRAKLPNLDAIKVVHGAKVDIFDVKNFSKFLSSAIPKGFKGVYELNAICSVRISFGKGFGKDYRRRSILNCPCWIEIRLHRPLQLIDSILTKIDTCDPNLITSSS